MNPRRIRLFVQCMTAVTAALHAAAALVKLLR